MRSLDLDQLRSFVAVAEAGSISAGAGRVFRSQSAVSEQLQKLEAAAGAALLSRSRQGVGLTPAGRRLIGHARELLALGELALHEVRNEVRRTDARLAISDYFRSDEIAGLLAQLGRRCPQLRLQVGIGQSAALAQGHAEGRYDLAVVLQVDGARARAPGVALRREALHWIAAPGLDLREQAELPLVLLPPDCGLHALALQRLRRHRSAHRVAHQASGVAGLQAALRAGLGVGCLNASAIGAGLAIARSPRLPPLPDCGFALLTPPDQAPAALHDAASIVRAFFA